MNNSNKQRGVALITALLVVSLATVLAVSLVDQLHYDIRRTENILRLDQAQLYNTNAVEFTMGLMELDFIDNKYDGLDQYSEANAQVFPIPGGQISGITLDLQGCFNLNTLSKKNTHYLDQRATFISLLGQTGIEGTLHNTLADSLIDWLDTDHESTNSGAEFDYYIGLEKPYRTANTLMVSPSELRLVKGYTAEVFSLIHDFVCVLPSVNTAININTASAEMIESIKGLGGHSEQIIKDRDQDVENIDDDKPFDTIKDFERYGQGTLKLKANEFDPKLIQVYSEYFLLKSTTQLGEREIVLFSLIYRDQSDGQTRVIQQSRSEL